MVQYVLRYDDPPLIERVDFEILSTEAILAQSVVEVTDPTLYSRGAPATNGLNDLRMGTVDR